MPSSPLFRPDYATRWATFDPLVGSLLDQAGLARRDSDGFRILPDGRRSTLVVEHTSEKTADIDAFCSSPITREALVSRSAPDHTFHCSGVDRAGEIIVYAVVGALG